MPVHVNLPSLIRVDGPSRLDSPDWLDDALSAGLRRAVTAAREHLTEQGLPVQGTVHPPRISWSGSGVALVDAGVRQAVEARVRRIVERLVAGQDLAGTAAAAGPETRPRRAWLVLTEVNLRMRVQDYFEYMRHVMPGQDYSQYFLDVLHETRWCTVWLAQTNVAVEAEIFYPTVIRRMNELSPLDADDMPLWTATPREADRRALIRIDRQHRVATNISDLARHNRGRVVGTRLQALLLPGARILLTRMRMPALPQIAFGPGGADVFWSALRRSLLEGDGALRSDTIDTLIDLRMYPGARQLLQEGMDVAQDPADLARLDIRHDIVRALEDYPGRPHSIALLILYGVGHRLDTTAQRIFRDWFKTGNGRDALAFLERVLLEGDPEQTRKAAIIVLDLLDFARTEEAGRYPRSVARLRALARRQDLWAGGPLGEESLRQLLRGQVDVLLEQVERLDRSLLEGPLFDPHKEEDRGRLAAFHEALTAYRESLATLSLADLETARTRLGGIILGAMHVQARIDGIHGAVRRIRDFLGSINADSDEVTVLFRLRSRYVATLAEALTAADFALSLREADIEGDNFAQTVAQFKFERARRAFGEAVAEVINNRTLEQFDGHGPVEEEGFFDMRRQIRQEMEDLRERFHPPPMMVGGRRLRIIGPDGRPIDVGHAQDINDAVDIETRVAVFRIHAAMFGHFSVALMLENQIVEHEIGSGSFRRRERARLSDIRREIVRDWNENRLQDFIDRDREIVQTLEDVQREIRRAVREAIALELLITAAAALLSMGAGLIVRAAMVGRTVGLLRTARAVETAVFLTEAGVFTGTQLAGQALAFDRPITLGRAARAAAGNLAFLGGFRLLGSLTAPLLERGAWGFVAVHTINAATATAASAVATRVQTGRWPQDTTTFLAHAIGGYLVFAGAGATARALLHPRLAPLMTARIQEGARRLEASSQVLLRQIQTSARQGRLTRTEFGRLKQGLRDNLAQARELGRQMQRAGLRSREQFRRFDEALTRVEEVIAAFEFNPPAGFLARYGGERAIAALPAPDSVPGVVRQGTSETYRYNALQPPQELETALARYGDAGYRIERLPGGIIRVNASDGRLAFVLDPGPRALPPGPEPLALLPAGAPARPLTLIERAMGRGYVSETSLRAVELRLDVINPRLREVLANEFQEHTVLLALRVFAQQYPQPWTSWRLDSVRGVATMLQTQRGISLRAVQRMFESRTSSVLNRAFAKYHAIADRPGANLLVSEELRPGSSIQLIEAYDAIRRARLRLPDGMNARALSGLLRWIRDGRNVVQELRRIPLEERLARLEAESPIRDPRPLPSAIQQVLQRHAAPIRPGIDLFAGTPADVTNAIVAYGQRSGGRFQRVEARNEFERLVRRYREQVSSYQASDVSEATRSGRRRIIEGAREEINTVLVAFELGAEVFSVGDAHAFRLSIDPAMFELPRGYRLTGAPDRVPIQLDVGARTVSGRLLVIEATTGDISLPREWSGLDSQSGEPANGTISWSALDEGNASHRKWLQAVKLRAAARFAHQLGESWGGTTVEMPELVIRVRRATAPARRALEAMGFRVVETEPSP